MLLSYTVIHVHVYVCVCERSLLSKQIVIDKKTNIALRGLRGKSKNFLNISNNWGNNKNRFVGLHFKDGYDAKVVVING